ncbi:MAG: hypothetical protein IJZ77_06235 [Bacilli bacterium]|nr:hypothetical protein [Bacilli bacterium]MBQ8424594.1 hypothetical protein [Clostridia bacterium]
MRLKWYVYVICITVILIGILCSMNLYEVFNIASKEYGTAVTIETKNEYVEVSKFDLGSLIMDSEDYVNFTFSSIYPAESFDGKNHNYTILFNGNPLSNIDISSGKISGDMTFRFYDLDGEVITSAKIHVSIEYYASGTILTITSVNVNDSMAYLTTYSNINGAVIKVVEKV